MHVGQVERKSQANLGVVLNKQVPVRSLQSRQFKQCRAWMGDQIILMKKYQKSKLLLSRL